MNTRTLHTAAAMAAFVFIGACNSEPEVIGGPVDSQAEALKNAPPVTLPPAIRESKVYRCRDNSVVYVNFLTDGNANVRSVEDEPPSATLTRQSPDGPLTGNGFSLSGSGDTVNFASPDVPSQSCRSNGAS
jgi:hypothetical protein